MGTEFVGTSSHIRSFSYLMRSFSSRIRAFSSLRARRIVLSLSLSSFYLAFSSADRAGFLTALEITFFVTLAGAALVFLSAGLAFGSARMAGRSDGLALVRFT